MAMDYHDARSQIEKEPVTDITFPVNNNNNPVNITFPHQQILTPPPPPPPSSYYGMFEISVLIFMPTIFLALLIIFYLLIRLKSDSTTRNDTVKEFYDGGDSSEIRRGTAAAAADGLNGPYKKSNHELAKNSFKIDETAQLGSGAFGKVCRGILLKKRSGGENEEVAVKMTKVPCPKSALRGILFEIKILSYLGRHPHIVELKGAYTGELRKGKAFVFLELCGLGSLEGYLRECKVSLRRRHSSKENDDNAEKMDGYEYEYGGSKNEAKLDESLLGDMSRWSREIASGLEFIASKYIVHLDIASRNILLTDGKSAKITDFGLSRRMYDYQTYVKKEREPLPWRWMAPESLRTSEFSEKSDVWSYGILLWEIYSLGDEPYPGQSWEINFPLKLERGLRLGEPPYNNDSMYSVMLRCWAGNPGRRPTFAKLVQDFAQKSSEVGDNNEVEEELGPAALTAAGHSFEMDTNENNFDKKSLHPKTASGNFCKLFSKVGLVWTSLAILLLLMISIISIITIMARSQTETAHEEELLKQCQIIFRNDKEVNKELSRIIRADISTNANKNNDSSDSDIQIPLPILFAAANGKNKSVSLKIITCLIEQGAENITSTDKDGHTFLHKLLSNRSPNNNDANASLSEFRDLVKQLLAKNASSIIFNIRNWDKVTPFQWAVQSMELDDRTLSLLRYNGVDFNAVNKDGESVLFYAVFGKRTTRLLADLIAHGANPKHRTNGNETLLHFSALWGTLEQLKFFLDKGLGLDVNAVESSGRTALHELVHLGREAVYEKVRLLIEYGAEVNTTDVRRDTPLSDAIRRSDWMFPDQVVQLLKNNQGH